MLLNALFKVLQFEISVFDVSWRTLAYQEVRFWIGPLAKLGCFKSTANNFLAYIVTISLESEPIQSLTSSRQFHQHFTHTFFVQKSFLSLEFGFEQTFLQKICA